MATTDRAAPLSRVPAAGRMPRIMQIRVHDILAELRELYSAAMHPRERFRRAGPLLLDPGMAIAPLARARAAHGRDWPALEVMELAGCDGLEAVKGAQVWGLFNPARSLDASIWEFDQYAALDFRRRVDERLARIAALLPLPQAQVDCLPLPCDSASRPLMIFGHGLSVYGAAPGLILLRAWPGGGNLERLPAALARAWAQTLRHLVFGRETLRCLADYLVMEGLGAALARRLQPDLATPWLASFSEPAAWQDELRRIAQTWYGVADYSDVTTNVYGASAVMGHERPPPAQALDAETLALSIAELGESLDAGDPLSIAAALYGDEWLALNGHPPAGIPAWAGLEIGHRLVSAWLESNGATPADALMTPTTRLVSESQLFDHPL